MNNKQKMVFILIADHDDRFLTTAILQELGHNVPLRFLSDPADLFAALQEKIPSIILMDYNLAPQPGIALLKQLKSDERYLAIPVVILTDSPLWQHHAQCYSHGASTVIKKPESSEMTTYKIRAFFDYWINVAETQ